MITWVGKQGGCSTHEMDQYDVVHFCQQKNMGFLLFGFSSLTTSCVLVGCSKINKLFLLAYKCWLPAVVPILIAHLIFILYTFLTYICDWIGSISEPHISPKIQLWFIPQLCPAVYPQVLTVNLVMCLLVMFLATSDLLVGWNEINGLQKVLYDFPFMFTIKEQDFYIMIFRSNYSNSFRFLWNY